MSDLQLLSQCCCLYSCLGRAISEIHFAYCEDVEQPGNEHTDKLLCVRKWERHFVQSISGRLITEIVKAHFPSSETNAWTFLSVDSVLVL